MEIKTDFKNEINNAINFANDLNNFIEFEHELIKNYKGFGIVYFLYLINNKDKSNSLVYIGKSKGSLFKARIKNHFYKKHSKTGSKLINVKNELTIGNEVKLKFLKVLPESFRSSLEEELINHFKPNWNII